MGGMLGMYPQDPYNLDILDFGSTRRILAVQVLGKYMNIGYWNPEEIQACRICGQLNLPYDGFHRFCSKSRVGSEKAWRVYLCGDSRMLGSFSSHPQYPILHRVSGPRDPTAYVYQASQSC